MDLSACTDGLDRFIEQTNNTDDAVEVASLVGGINTYYDFLWLAGKKLGKDKIIKFACDCALINIEKIKPYTVKYELIVGFLESAGKANADSFTALDAARDARDAAWAVFSYVAAIAAFNASSADTEYACASIASLAASNAADAGDERKVDELLKELFGG